MDKDLESIQQARKLSEKSLHAYKNFSSFSQEKVDAIIRSMVEAGISASRELAELAVRETSYGRVEHKVAKNLFSTRNVYESIKDLKTVGVIDKDEKKKIITIVHPMGVIAAVTPTTNPTSTVMFKALVSVKSRNAIVFAPHPNAAECSKRAADIMSIAAESAGAPPGLVSCMDVVTLEGTQELMASPNISIILATGGLSMVKAAHSFGKPAIGVGPGNTPAYIDKSANLKKAASDIIASKTFDNGVICSSEQAIIVHSEVENRFRGIMEGQGCYFLSRNEIEILGKLFIKNGKMDPSMVGKSINYISNASNLSFPPYTKLLIALLGGVGPKFPLSREILSPVLAYYTAGNWEKGCDRCIEILNFGGLGHTMAIHAIDEKVIDEFARKKPVFRILVNTPTSQGAIGLTTSLTPSMTLSTGTWGGGISTDNISAYNLLNFKRVAYETVPIDGQSDKNQSSTGITEKEIEDLVRETIKQLGI
ncbi:MAG: aldehyde dehydrogenase family protein [Candidatus Humimicrobiaceae bacterium]